MNHAVVRVGEYQIPLIGIPPSATEYECDLCHDVFPIEEIELNKEGNQFLCKKCNHKNI